MAELKNLIGQKFGKLTVVGRAENDKNGRAKWICKCDCGNPDEIIIRSQHLIRGDTTSCGCEKLKRKNLIGQVFGKLTVVSSAEDKITKRGTRIQMWNCVCECGNNTIVDSYSLTSGHTKSCGCLQGEHHNDARHDVGRTRLYHIWQDIKQRCFNDKNDNYKNYGGRGITMCDEWANSYMSFKEWSLNNGYEENLSLDRIYVNGNYEPCNCRWATQKTQANNTRTNRLITFNGETLTLSQWRDKLGFKRGVIEYRLNAGWPIEDVMLIPVKQSKTSTPQNN